VAGKLGVLMNDDDFFSPLENTKPYLKVAFEGFAGCGKTFTMAQLAAGLHTRIGSTKPIVIFDTERAAKFLRPFFADHGIKILHKESRSLADLREAMKRCREGASDILLIDSISHIWESFLAAYAQKVRRTRLEFQDWGIIKPTWKAEFSDPFVRDPYHCMMTGRAGYEYAQEKDDQGKRQLVKTGIKMKVEGETAYEPDMLVLMERFEELLTDQRKVWREAMIIKDRSNLIDGKSFTNPTYHDFSPAIEAILSDPTERRPSAEGDASRLFRTEEDKREYTRKRDILLEEIEAYMVSSGFAGTGAEAKRNKVDSLKAAFGTASWTAIQATSVDRLGVGFEALKMHIAAKLAEGKPAEGSAT
jgi:hypothetical protein